MKGAPVERAHASHSATQRKAKFDIYLPERPSPDYRRRMFITAVKRSESETHERNPEIERSALLLTNCGPKLLEQKGLALGSLGVVGINIGLGGKTLVELEHPTALHTSQSFPPHNFRYVRSHTRKYGSLDQETSLASKRMYLRVLL
ncbi:hypothetical protein BDR07DRAFT_1458618, partial [Suillus spraguei]